MKQISKKRAEAKSSESQKPDDGAPRKNPEEEKILIQSCMIQDLSESQRERLVLSFCALARGSLKAIAGEYIYRRMSKYKILTLIRRGAGGELAGFSFSDVYFARFLGAPFPVFHCGLILLARDFRGRGLSTEVCASLYKLVTERKMIKRPFMLLFGLLFTAKCSSPVSFLKIRKLSRGFSWPKIKDGRGLSRLSRSGWSRALSRFLSRRMGGPVSEDFILRGVNKESGFQLDEEDYVFHSKKEKAAVDFFRSRILPESELITVAWFHPLWLWLREQRRPADKAGSFKQADKAGSFKKPEF